MSTIKNETVGAQNSETLKPFGTVRSLLFPIYKHEFKKVLPMMFIFFVISFVYAAVRGLKDNYVLTCMQGAESIYPLKICVIPSVILFTIVYSCVCRHTDKYGRFNYVMIYFFCFFFVFRYILLPAVDFLQLEALYNILYSRFPSLSAVWKIIRYWPVSMFYIHAEAFGTMALSVAFWSFANDIFSSKQAKRVYGFIMIGAAVGTLISGVVALRLSKNIDSIFLVILGLLMAMLLVYNVLALKIKENPEAYEIETEKKTKTKVKVGFFESLKYLARSKYLVALACIVGSYNMFIVLIESIWKNKLNVYKQQVAGEYLDRIVEKKNKEYMEEEIEETTSVADIIGSAQGGYPIGVDESTGEQIIYTPSKEKMSECKKVLSDAKDAGKEAVAAVQAYQSIFTGIISLFIIFFVSSYVSKKSWKVRALFTPVIGAILTLVLFVLFKYEKTLVPLSKFFDGQLVYTFVISGLVILVFIKSSKYIFFDSSKEQAYIPLPSEEKTRGKAVIDGVMSRFWKAASSIILLVLSVVFGSLGATANAVFVLIFVLIALWLIAVKVLEPLYKEQLRLRELEKQEEEKKKRIEEQKNGGQRNVENGGQRNVENGGSKDQRR